MNIRDKIKICKAQKAENNKLIKNLRLDRQSILPTIESIEIANRMIDKEIENLGKENV